MENASSIVWSTINIDNQMPKESFQPLFERSSYIIKINVFAIKAGRLTQTRESNLCTDCLFLYKVPFQGSQALHTVILLLY